MGDSNWNLFCTTSGTENKWELETNIFCRFNGNNNNIISRRCVNTKLKGHLNSAVLMDNVNLKIKGDNNLGTLVKNLNMNLIGNCNNGQMDSNVNVEILGNKNVLNLDSNLNASIHGHGNTINAKDNINLKVEGNDHKITSLVTTINHNLKIAENGCPTNRLEIQAKKGSGVNKTDDGQTKIKTTHCNPWTFYINYVREMRIDRHKYRLGIFDFKMQIKDNGRAVQASFDHCKYEKGVLNSVVEPPGKVTLAATKAGKQETLEMVGPTVSIKQTNGMTKVLIS